MTIVGVIKILQTFKITRETICSLFLKLYLIENVYWESEIKKLVHFKICRSKYWSRRKFDIIILKELSIEK